MQRFKIRSKFLLSTLLVSFFLGFSGGVAIETSYAAVVAEIQQTGQSKCYAEDGVSSDEIACADTGQDGELRKGVAWPTPRFTDNSDGTVTDTLTGLIWLKDASCDVLGANGNGSATFADALLAANSLASGTCGLSDSSAAGDWHLPNIKEMWSLSSRDFSDPPFPDTAGTGQWTEGQAFTDVQINYYWSNTSSAANPTYAFSVNSRFGNIYHNSTKNLERYVWPVKEPVSANYPAMIPQTGQETCYDPSGNSEGVISCSGTGQDGDLQIGTPFPAPRFTNNGNGTVTDNLTDLVWLQEAGCLGNENWADALSRANNLSDTGTPDLLDDCGLEDRSVAGDWRLPNVRELASLVHYEYASPAISNSAGDGQLLQYGDDPFTFVRSYLWSSTSVPGSPTGAYRVTVGIAGEDTNDRKDSDYGVWPVRDRQFLLNIALTGDGGGSVVSNPAGLNCGSDCNKEYTKNSTVILTATAAPGSSFKGWTGGGCVGREPCSVLVGQALTVTATFDERSPWILFLSPILNATDQN